MTPNEIFARMSVASAATLLGEIFENEKALYRNLIETLAKQRKLRPVFIERKPRQERFMWIKEALARKANESVAAHFLQIWLVSQHSDLLCDFLDGLGIKHDTNGTVEELPQAPSRSGLERVIDEALKKYDVEIVRIYLHAFQALDDKGGWSTLDEILRSDKRLQFGESTEIVANSQPAAVAP